MRIAVAVLVLLGVTLVAAISPPRFARVSRRVINDQCGPGKVVGPNTVYDLNEDTIGTAAKTCWDPKGKTYTCGFSPLDGHDTTGETPTPKLVDYCHIDPALCTGKASFCGGAAKAACCPHGDGTGKKNAIAVGKALGLGCGPNVPLGMARLFMPQVADEAKFFAFTGAKNAHTGAAGKNLNDLSFSQGEVLANKILGMACQVNAKGAFVSKTTKDDPYVCSDDFVLDGHHRVAAYKFFNQYLLPKSAQPKIVTLPVNYLSLPCSNIIPKLAKEIDWTGTVAWDPKTGAYTYPTPALDYQAKPTPVPLGAKYSGLLELEARFGAAAHATVAAARAAYVEQTRERLWQIGVTLKGGDEALAMHFDYKHAPVLFA